MTRSPNQLNSSNSQKITKIVSKVSVMIFKSFISIPRLKVLAEMADQSSVPPHIPSESRRKIRDFLHAHDWGRPIASYKRASRWGFFSTAAIKSPYIKNTLV